MKQLVCCSFPQFILSSCLAFPLSVMTCSFFFFLIIGEILELNPRFKAPPDYKPVLKEARLPIDVSSYLTSGFKSLYQNLACVCYCHVKSLYNC